MGNCERKMSQRITKSDFETAALRKNRLNKIDRYSAHSNGFGEMCVKVREIYEFIVVKCTLHIHLFID